GSVCLMMTTSPQFWMVLCTNSTSCGFEVKLDPDERDSHTCCGKEKHLPLRFRTCVRLTPNSANSFISSGVPWIPLSEALMCDVFALPSNSVPFGGGVITFAPQHGGALLFT